MKIAIVVVIFLKYIFQLSLEVINNRKLLSLGQKPEAVDWMEDETFEKAKAYTLAKSAFKRFEITFDVLILIAVLFSGFLPFYFDAVAKLAGESIWAQSLSLLVLMMALSWLGLPLEIYQTFVLEERFGFNKSSVKLFIVDKIKGLLLGLVIGVPLLVLLLLIVNKVTLWWLWGFILLSGFQLLMLVLYPKFILPLFNKLKPLPEGELQNQLLELAEKTEFPAKTIEIMDGSKRSGHSNAFFTGFGKIKHIVLFDTLVEQLSIPQLKAVLAHEIGHYKRGHIPKRIIFAFASTLIGFFFISLLMEQSWFYALAGFQSTFVDTAMSTPAAFLLFALLSGTITFWFTPLSNISSRKHEYEADGFAKEHVGESESLVESLKILSEKNLSNPQPHSFYSFFYYSHPSLSERIVALRQEK